MHRTSSSNFSSARLTLAIVALFLPTSLAAASQTAVSNDPWEVLVGMRTAMAEAGPSTVEFVQTFLPVGFTEGEREEGVLALALPRCLRWDYREPYPKSFLLCDDLYYHWNPEDRTGIRGEVQREDEPGLDLLLVEVADLETRYRATLAAPADGTVEVKLIPKEPMTQLREATLRMDDASGRLVALEYTNLEGSWTRFELGEPGPLAEAGQFEPPHGITWEEP